MKSPIMRWSGVVHTVFSLGALLGVLGPGGARAQGVTFAVGDYTTQPGATVTAAVTVTNFDSVLAAQFTLQWDPTVLDYQGLGNFNSALGVAAEDFGAPGGSPVLTNGVLTFSWFDENLSGVTVPDGTVIFTVSLTVIGSAGSASVLALPNTAATLTPPLAWGSNYDPLSFIAVDGQVQVSALASTYTVTASVSPAGAGTAGGGGACTNGAPVVLTASTNAGYQFVAWTENGQVVSASPSYSFTVSGDRSLVANFAPYPFVPPKETYGGLFAEGTNGVSPQSCGSFTFNTAAKSSYSGSLQLAGTRYTFSGQFDGSGRASKTLTRHGLAPLTLDLRLDLLSGGGWVSGAVGDGAWTAQLYGGCALVNAKTNVAPQAGNYTMVLPGAYGSTNEPAGDGYGTLTVSKAGVISLQAVLADGTKLAPSATLLNSGLWPLYASLYSGQGVLFGWLTFTNAAGLGGSLAWLKPVATPGAYAAGFSVTVPALGARYLPPGKGTNVLGLTASTNLTLALTGGGLTQDITNRIALAANGRVTMLSGPKLSLTFTPVTGAFAGSVLNPASSSPILFGGVVSQSERTGSGFFLHNGQSGQVRLEP